MKASVPTFLNELKDLTDLQTATWKKTDLQSRKNAVRKKKIFAESNFQKAKKLDQ